MQNNELQALKASGILSSAAYIRMQLQATKPTDPASFYTISIRQDFPGATAPEIFNELANLTRDGKIEGNIPTSFTASHSDPSLLTSYSPEQVRQLRGQSMFRQKGYLFFCLGADNPGKTSTQLVDPARITQFYGLSMTDFFGELGRLTGDRTITTDIDRVQIRWISYTAPVLQADSSTVAIELERIKTSLERSLSEHIQANDPHPTYATDADILRLSSTLTQATANFSRELDALSTNIAAARNVSAASFQQAIASLQAQIAAEDVADTAAIQAAVTSLQRGIDSRNYVVNQTLSDTVATLQARITAGDATQASMLQASVNMLQAAINGKQATGDYVPASTLRSAIASLQTAIDSKQIAGDYATTQTVTTAIGNLQKAIDSKNYVMGDSFNSAIASLQTAINSKQAVGDYASTAALTAAVSSLQNAIALKQSTFVINAGDYGAKGDLVYREVTYNTVGIVSGTDTTAKIQAALNAAGAMVPQDVNLPYEGAVRVVIPPGKYIIAGDKGLDVPSNVIFDSAGAVFFNFLNNDWEPIIKGRRHSHATIIKVHANKKSGVEWGDRNGGGVRCDSYIDAVWVEHAGVEFESSLAANRQKCGLRLFGLWFRINRIEIKEANIGLDLYQCSDVLCPAVFLMGCSTALRMESAEQIILPAIALDTNITTGLQIDNSGNVFCALTAFINSDGYGTAMDTLLRIGQYSGVPCKDIYITAAATSIGGRMLSISNCMDSAFTLYASNARLFSQTSGNGQANSHWNSVNWSSPSGQVNGGGLLAHDIGVNYQPYGNEGTPTAAIAYGANLSGYLDIRLLASAGIKPTEGTQYGNLTVNGQAYPILVIPKVWRSSYNDNPPQNPQLWDVWEANYGEGDNSQADRWTWNGVCWMSDRKLAKWSFNNVSAASSFFEYLNFGHGVLFEWFMVGMKTGASNSASAYATFTLSRRNSSGVSTALASMNTQAIAAGGRLYQTKDIKTGFAIEQAIDAVISLTLTGATGAMNGTANFSYRYVW